MISINVNQLPINNLMWLNTIINLIWFRCRLCCPADAEDVAVDGAGRQQEPLVHGHRSVHVPETSLALLSGLTDDIDDNVDDNIDDDDRHAALYPISGRERRHLGRARTGTQRLLQRHRQGSLSVRTFVSFS